MRRKCHVLIELRIFVAFNLIEFETVWTRPDCYCLSLYLMAMVILILMCLSEFWPLLNGESLMIVTFLCCSIFLRYLTAKVIVTLLCRPIFSHYLTAKIISLLYCMIFSRYLTAKVILSLLYYPTFSRYLTTNIGWVWFKSKLLAKSVLYL